MVYEDALCHIMNKPDNIVKLCEGGCDSKTNTRMKGEGEYTYFVIYYYFGNIFFYKFLNQIGILTILDIRPKGKIFEVMSF